MKLNWGTGIALVYGLFALTMVAVVVKSRSYNPGLVDKDYYKLDLNYQQHLAKKQNAARLNQGLQVRFDAAGQVIRLEFPPNLGTPAGSVKCFRSSTVKDDRLLKIEANADGLMEIPTGEFAPGLWNLEVDWQAQGTGYFNSTLVTIIRA
ncbi:MAG: FixH family protein [Saprospiraceae bacterium]|nr:FixH family protein [Lewinellaceae bacterium]